MHGLHLQVNINTALASSRISETERRQQEQTELPSEGALTFP